MGINYRTMTYKDFHSICKDSIERTFGQELNNSSSKELYTKFKWYAGFIHYFIKNNRIHKLDSFEPKLKENIYFQQDADMTIKLFHNIKMVLLDKFMLIDIMDISNFCEKVESDVKI